MDAAFGKHSELGGILKCVSEDHKLVVENVETWKRLLPEMLMAFPDESPMTHRTTWIRQAFERCLRQKPGTFPLAEDVVDENNKMVAILQQVEQRRAEARKGKRPIPILEARKGKPELVQ